jgi:tRNA (guanine26-N2/guanine27-N2)-dimethyltransferase
VIHPPESIEIQEGATRLFVPELHSIKGPGKRVGRVFYNGQMAFNRDISVAFLRTLDLKGRKALDAMAATGARGIRLANEAGEGIEITLNDRDAAASEYIQANIELNQLSNCTRSNEDLRCHLARKVYDYIDLDPFGTPAPFMQACLQGLKRNGVLAITATDTAPLAGTHAKKCVRRYMARPLRSVFGHETGLRILIGYIAREAAQLDKGVEPLLCFYADHYFRCYLRVRDSAAAADEALGKLGYLTYDPVTHERGFGPDYRQGSYGPMWGAPIIDHELMARMNAEGSLEAKGRCAKYIDLWREIGRASCRERVYSYV